MELKEMATKLAEKQSWIKKGFEDWLKKWEEATSTGLDDPKLERLILCRSGIEERMFIYLKRGSDKLNQLYDDAYGHEDFSQSEYISADIELLRKILPDLKKRIEKYIEQLKTVEEEYELLQKLIQK